MRVTAAFIRTKHTSHGSNFTLLSGIFISFMCINVINKPFSCFANSYEIGCIYPRQMLEPFAARAKILGFTGVYSGTGGANSPGNANSNLETPIAVHQGQAFSYCDVNCLAHHDSKTLNGISKQRPRIVVPAEMGHNSWSRMMCIAQCYSILFAKEGNAMALETIKDAWKLQVESSIEEEIVDHYDTNYDLVEDYAIGKDYDPLVIGRLVAHEIEMFMKNDGWNMDGSMLYDPASAKMVPCTANCIPYRDTHGYVVKNHPGSMSIPVRPEMHVSDSFIVNGTNRYWQPLLEDDGTGYLSRQEHVTPHIGFSAIHKLRDPSLDSLDLPDPQYDYHQESLLVIDRLQESALDTTKWDKISFYDKKFLVRLLIQEAMKEQFKDSYTFEDELLFNHGIGAAEYDSILHAWRHKVHHDLVRPTTVIQTHFGERNMTFTTFNGDRKSPMKDTIQARDVQAFARVMPHSEYPSGSSCICKSYAEFVDTYTQNIYGKGTLLTDMYWGYGGIDFGCDERSLLDPSRANFLGCKQGGFPIANMEALSNECGESRLWGGMHFTASVGAGRDLCEGLGALGWDYMTQIRNGSELGLTHIRDVGERPQCSADTDQPTLAPSKSQLRVPSSPTNTNDGPGDLDGENISTRTDNDSSEISSNDTENAYARGFVVGILCSIVAFALVILVVHIVYKKKMEHLRLQTTSWNGNRKREEQFVDDSPSSHDKESNLPAEADM